MMYVYKLARIVRALINYDNNRLSYTHVKNCSAEADTKPTKLIENTHKREYKQVKRLRPCRKA